MSTNIFEDAMLLAAGGVIGLIASAVMEDEEKKEEKPMGDGKTIEEMFASLQEEAQQAIASCETEEEREAVRAHILQSVQKMQENLAEHGTSVAEHVKNFSQMLSDFGEMMRLMMADGDGFTAGQASMRHMMRDRL